MNGRTPTASERKWMLHLADLGCIACWKMGYANSPAEIHHIAGSRKPGCHFLTLPLCPKHHRHKCNAQGKKLWISRHGDGKRAFEAEYGTEDWLLGNAVGRLEFLYGDADWLLAAKEHIGIKAAA